ncbi:MAG TPA: cytochrome c [Nitrospiria bacterium]|nr:cytochrome c [Nitrospiria bacterium]
MIKKVKQISILVKAIVLVAVIYLGLKFFINPPLPSSLISMYIALTLIAIFLYVTLFEDKIKEFLSPMVNFLKGRPRESTLTGYARWGVLVLFPFLVGMTVYSRLAPSDAPPIEQRVVHPAPPAEFVGLSNPVPKTPQNISEGSGLFAVFCSPCHGGKLDGKGPQAIGFNPPPANFTDPGTIAQLQESYLFWRIKKGGVGLPVEGQPWNSAMPRWEAMPARGGKPITDEQIWKIIMWEYEGAGVEPRTWD